MINTYDNWKATDETGEFWRCPVCGSVSTYGEGEPCSRECDLVIHSEGWEEPSDDDEAAA